MAESYSYFKHNMEQSLNKTSSKYNELVWSKLLVCDGVLEKYLSEEIFIGGLR